MWRLFLTRESSTSANIVTKPLRHRIVAWRTSVRFIADEPSATDVVTAARCARNPELSDMNWLIDISTSVPILAASESSN